MSATKICVTLGAVLGVGGLWMAVGFLFIAPNPSFPLFCTGLGLAFGGVALMGGTFLVKDVKAARARQRTNQV